MSLSIILLSDFGLSINQSAYQLKSGTFQIY